MIKAIFFARFHPEKGPRVLHQVPEGAVIAHRELSDSEQAPLFDFHAVSGLIIPGQEFCDRPITVCTNHCRIIGYPVCIASSRYDRNQFIFNFALVLDEDSDFDGYMNIVRKLASLFRNLEEQSKFLSKEEDAELWASVTGENETDSSMMELQTPEDNKSEFSSAEINRRPDHIIGGKVYALCEMIFEDLNNYYECMIPIDDSNTINLKLFPTRPPPAPIYAWHVPLSTVQLSTLAITSDLTLTRILPFINGISSVAQISQRADTDLNLTRKAVAHLLYYGCIILLDIFQFSAVYAPTAEIGAFIEDFQAQEEAVRYVSVGQYRRLTERELDGSTTEKWGWKSNETGIDRARLVQLYASLRQGLTLKNWCLEHGLLLAGIDVRRLITFGVIKGFIYRVHKYAVVDGANLANENGQLKPVEEFAFDAERVEYWRESRRGSLAGSSVGKDLPLARYLDGMHCFDEICTELHLSEKKVTEKMKTAYSDVQFIYR